MDQRPYPGPPFSFHVRTIALFIILWIVDITTFLVTIEYMLTFGIGGTVLFTSEVVRYAPFLMIRSPSYYPVRYSHSKPCQLFRQVLHLDPRSTSSIAERRGKRASLGRQKHAHFLR